MAIRLSSLQASRPLPTTAQVTISNGQNLSGAVDLNGVLCGIITPATLAGTYIEFYVSSALAGTYVQLTDNFATPIRYPFSTSIALDVEKYLFFGKRFLKIATLSNSTGTIQNQSADRTLTLLIQP